RLDRGLNKLTRGRVIVSKFLLPSLVLTTTGQRSGEPRETPIACLPEGDGWYVVGSNFGKEKHPAWTGNLLKTPQAQVVYNGRTVAVTARLLDDDEKAGTWDRLTSAWPAYDAYVEASGRNLRVFHLTPA